MHSTRVGRLIYKKHYDYIRLAPRFCSTKVSAPRGFARSHFMIKLFYNVEKEKVRINFDRGKKL
jgi:hypothetical protein